MAIMNMHPLIQHELMRLRERELRAAVTYAHHHVALEITRRSRPGRSIRAGRPSLSISRVRVVRSAPFDDLADRCSCC
jgi:hypothetical protein